MNSLKKLLKNLAHGGTIVGLIVAIIIPFLIYLGPNVGHKSTIQMLDLKLPMPLFLVQLAAGIALLVMLHKDLRDWLKSILPAKPYCIAILVFTAAITIFAGTQIEARHRVQSDESIFLSVAQNMFYNQESGTCNQGYFENGSLNCIAKSNSFKTKGLAFLYLIGMPFLGTDLHWIFNMELAMLPLAILLMFLAVVAWTRQPLLAFFASLLMALQPTVLFQFRAMSVEPLYIFLSALALLVFKWTYDRNTIKHWAILALVLAFFAQTRQETVFCFAPFILFALPKLLDSKSAKCPTFFVILSVFSTPVLLTISYFQGFGFQGGEFSAHGHFLEDLVKNWQEMTLPLKENGELTNPFLTYFNYLFAVGGIYLLCRAVWDSVKGSGESRYFYLKMLAFLLLYHIQTYMILENVSGDFGIQINQRYSLVMIPSMAFVAALPIAHLIQALANSLSDKKPSPVTLIAIMILVALGFTGWTFHYKADFNNNIMYNRNHLTVEEHSILEWLGELPKKPRMFIYGRPWHFVGYGISSIHYDRARNLSSEDMQKLIDRYQGEVYYIRGLDCWDSKTYHKKAVEHRIPTTCDVFEREMEMDGIKNILITNNYWVQIAKFNGRKNYNTQKIIDVQEPKLTEAQPAEKNLNEVDENTDVNKVVTDTLSISYSLKESSEAIANWELIITLNNKIMIRKPYQLGEFQQVTSTEALQPGFNQFRFIVNDTSKQKKLVDKVINYMNKEGGAIPLTELNYESHQQGWGNLHFNTSIEGKKMTVDGQNYDSGLGTHSPSQTTYDVGGKYSLFRTTVGLDDESLCSDGVFVEIEGDGKVLNSTPVFTNGTAHTLTVRIEGVQKLTLKSTPKGSKDCTHVDFVNAVLIP
ncbi:NPCBM/NEW2 domain-containing protein [Fibrobacter sp. UWH9]|uniref:NPCBM/NEW2 domain-containing protein n=1 Tax=Fibrobacter sp. UWH9 TaxID=1896213 RepID=UPI00091206D8|nr:NPCBM/NEW2 domain-containing protein [Fibrobacter sp. UWH9]SHH02661.1 NPCBM/NEW2 domain-containing protein [Fibrobacter sp. UWH9]